MRAVMRRPLQEGVLRPPALRGGVSLSAVTGCAGLGNSMKARGWNSPPDSISSFIWMSLLPGFLHVRVKSQAPYSSRVLMLRLG